MLDLSRLNPEQREAVTAGEGPVLVVAGPGSGKTTLLEELSRLMARLGAIRNVVSVRRRTGG